MALSYSGFFVCGNWRLPEKSAGFPIVPLHSVVFQWTRSDYNGELECSQIATDNYPENNLFKMRVK